MCVLLQSGEDTRQRHVQRRIENRWLGSIKTPFSTIYSVPKIEGTFRIQRPPVLLGYSTDSLQATDADDVTEHEQTYVSLFITFEPSLSVDEPAREKVRR